MQRTKDILGSAEIVSEDGQLPREKCVLQDRASTGIAVLLPAALEEQREDGHEGRRADNDGEDAEEGVLLMVEEGFELLDVRPEGRH